MCSPFDRRAGPPLGEQRPADWRLPRSSSATVRVRDDFSGSERLPSSPRRWVGSFVRLGSPGPARCSLSRSRRSSSGRDCRSPGRSSRAGRGTTRIAGLSTSRLPLLARSWPVCLRDGSLRLPPACSARCSCGRLRGRSCPGCTRTTAGSRGCAIPSGTGTSWRSSLRRRCLSVCGWYGGRDSRGRACSIRRWSSPS